MGKANVVLANSVPDTLSAIMEWKPTPVQRKTAIITAYLRGAEAYLIVGDLLCQAHKAEDWKKDGSEAKNFNEWVERELTIKRSASNRMMQVWTTIGPLLPVHAELIRKIDFSKLAMIIPVLRLLKDEQQILEWLHMAETNTVKDLENNIREKGAVGRKLKPTDTCLHDRLSTKRFVKCTVCGAFFPEADDVRKVTLNALRKAAEVMAEAPLLWGPEVKEVKLIQLAIEKNGG